jgi:hypothetical protein
VEAKARCAQHRKPAGERDEAQDNRQGKNLAPEHQFGRGNAPVSCKLDKDGHDRQARNAEQAQPERKQAAFAPCGFGKGCIVHGTSHRGLEGGRKSSAPNM